jgi:hypothetical protein
MTIQEAVRSLARHQAERHSQRVLLRIRETLGVGEHRYAELMESGIRQPQLGLHARNPGDLVAVLLGWVADDLTVIVMLIVGPPRRSLAGVARGPVDSPKEERSCSSSQCVLTTGLGRV